MGTAFAQVITQNGLVAINDERMYEDAKVNPALFFRTMSLYLINAIPLFYKPPDMERYLSFSAAQSDSYTYSVEEDKTAPVSITTGLKGYEMCSAGAVVVSNGNATYTPLSSSYDAETGVVTVNENLQQGATVEIDFYTDGAFDKTLTARQCRILGLCLQVVWENRFSGGYLARAPKLHDRSFAPPNEANWTRAQTERVADYVTPQLAQELNAYEQSLEYAKVMPATRRLI